MVVFFCGDVNGKNMLLFFGGEYLCIFLIIFVIRWIFIFL